MNNHADGLTPMVKRITLIMTGLVYGYPCLVLFPLDFPVQQSFEFFQHSLLSEYQSFVI